MRPVVELPMVKKIPVVYPESDGEPMGETEWHVFGMVDLLHVLCERFRGRPDVHVGGNLFIYYNEGDPTDVICPDVFVAFGAKPDYRRTWKTWEEGGLFPQVIFELVSDDSRRRDLVTKRGFYASWNVREYFAFDPAGESLEPPLLRGWRLQGDLLVPIEPESGLPGRKLRSDALGVLVEEDGERLRLIDAATSEPLPHADEETIRRRAAEAEVERLRAEIDRLKRER